MSVNVASLADATKRLGQTADALAVSNQSTAAAFAGNPAFLASLRADLPGLTDAQIQRALMGDVDDPAVLGALLEFAKRTPGVAGMVALGLRETIFPSPPPRNPAAN